MIKFDDDHLRNQVPSAELGSLSNDQAGGSLSTLPITQEPSSEEGTRFHHFTHLHVHSHYSLLGATPTVPALIAQASTHNFTHLALTDSNALYGAIQFSQACKQANIQPIIGMTLNIALPQDMRKFAFRNLVPRKERGSWEGGGQIVLLAKNRDGYRSLCALSSWLQGHPDRKERCRHGVPWDVLAKNHNSLICLAGGRQDWLFQLLQQGEISAANRYTARLGGLFRNRCYLALARHPRHPTSIEPDLLALSDQFGLPLVAVQPVYTLQPNERALLPLLAAIDRNCLLEEVPATDPTIDLHWLSPVEMAARFADMPAALGQVADIVAQCEPSLPDGSPLWPVLTDGDKSGTSFLGRNEVPAVKLVKQAQAGLLKHFDPAQQQQGKVRLNHELTTINQHGFAPLFLIVADVVEFARNAGIPVNTRGSVANSLVAYCLGITTVDPLAHDLYFERFLNPARTTLPDIDLDFCSRRRNEVLNYVRDKYGSERVALIATISTMKRKSAVRETAKALGLDGAAIKQLSKQLPRRWHPDPRRRDKRTLAEVSLTLTDDKERQVIAIADRLVGQPHHLSVHPGGVVIAPHKMIDVAPVQWASKGFLITQYDHRDVAALGLPKLDLLGIRALTVLSDAVAQVRCHHNPDFTLDSIPPDDPITAKILQQGQTIGVFQCDSAGSQRTLRQLQARNRRDLAVANAFFKPGPALGGMAAAFVRRYRGQEKVTYLHPALEPILGHTKGVLLFQEQILRIAREIAGMSWAEANQLRKGISKFAKQGMVELQTQFEAGCRQSSNFSSQQALALWEQVLPFSGYGFNQGHATAYAGISYHSAYIKAHWPAAFFAARLANFGGFHHPVIYIEEARRLGITVRPPHINFSQRHFTLTFEQSAQIETKTVSKRVHSSQPVEVRRTQLPILWMGLGQVRDLRRKSVQAIVAARQNAPFTSLQDLLTRVPLQTKEITHLIQCGALTGLGDSRTTMLAEAKSLGKGGGRGQLRFAFLEDGVGEEMPAESPQQQLTWERHILGCPVSHNPAALITAPNSTKICNLRRQPGISVTLSVVRLSGWTGGKGIFIGDGSGYLVACGSNCEDLRHWQPVLLQGHWHEDGEGNNWFQVNQIKQ